MFDGFPVGYTREGFTGRLCEGWLSGLFDCFGGSLYVCF